MPNSCRIVTGRLLEFDLKSGYRTVADLDALTPQFEAATQQVSGSGQLVVVADWRRVQVLPPEVSTHMIAMMASINHRVVRSALLHTTTQPTAVMQLLRLVRASENEQRRLFTEVEPLCAWLGEILDAPERVRLSHFLG
jgi:hypothetical protein